MRAAILLAALMLAFAAAPVSAQWFDDNLTPEVRAWLKENPWFGTDPERTTFARETARQLMKERPQLVGNALLAEVSKKVAEKFGPSDQPRKP